MKIFLLLFRTKSFFACRLQNKLFKDKVVKTCFSGYSTMTNETPVENCRKVKEGSAEIIFPDANSVFYNPVQEFNRDITIAVIREFAKNKLKNEKNSENNDASVTDKVKNDVKDGVTVLEALSATGLRSVRFAKEIEGIKKIVANDISRDAYELIKQNIIHNDVEDIVEATNSDAILYMHQNRGKNDSFDVIDVDPYGTASIFLDAAVQSVKHGGLLCVTCTDMAVFAGNFPEVAWSKYQSMPLRTKACHEQALRMLLGSISAHAARYTRYIEPLISISIDFYIRVFVRVHYGAGRVKEAANKQVYVYRCVGCSSYYTQPVAGYRQAGTNKNYHAAVAPPVNKLCDQCNHRFKMGGPFWGDRLHDLDFVNQVLKSVKENVSQFGSYERINGILTMITEELQDVPLHYVSDELSRVLKCNVPPSLTLRSAILNAGFKVSGFHGRVNSVKTNAPPSVIWDIMRKWVETQEVRKNKLPDNSPASSILSKAITNENISLELNANAKPPFKDIKRFPEMPANWGPKARAKVNKDGSLSVSESLKEKSLKFQGKRKKNKNESDENKKQKTTI